MFGDGRTKTLYYTNIVLYTLSTYPLMPFSPWPLVNQQIDGWC